MLFRVFGRGLHLSSVPDNVPCGLQHTNILGPDLTTLQHFVCSWCMHKSQRLCCKLACSALALLLGIAATSLRVVQPSRSYNTCLLVRDCLVLQQMSHGEQGCNWQAAMG